MADLNNMQLIANKIREAPDTLSTEEVEEYMAYRIELAVQEALTSASIERTNAELEARIEAERANAAVARVKLEKIALEAVEKYNEVDNG